MQDQPPDDVNAKAQNAISQREENQEQAKTSLRDIVEQRASEIYSDQRAKEFVSSLLGATERNPKIKNCSSTSILTAMTACIMLDLTPETNQQFAYLIPYGNMLQFQIGYKGLIELAYRSGEITSINAELVFKEDTFKFTLGTQRGIHHEPDMTIDRTDFAKATQVYATATLNNGTSIFDVMSISEIEKIRKSAKAKSTDAPWKTWPEQMAKKTVIKRMLKYAPQSQKDKRLQQAIDWDSYAEAGKLTLDENGKPTQGKLTPDLEPKKELKLKNYSKPIEIVEPEEVEENELQDIKLPTPPPDTKELINEIKDIIAFLKLSKTNEMKLIKKHSKQIYLKKATASELANIYAELEELAKAKTEYLASKDIKEEPTLDTDPTKPILDVFKDSKVLD